MPVIGTLAEGSDPLSPALTALETDCDFILLDCPGSHTKLSQMAHTLADTLITPMNDSFVDFDLLARLSPENVARLRGLTPDELGLLGVETPMPLACGVGFDSDMKGAW